MGETLTAFVRQMRIEDAAAVAALTTQLGYPSTEDDIRCRFDLIRDRADGQVFVALQSGDLIAGWLHVQVTHLLECDARAEICGLVVDAAARGAGVGRSLVEAAESWAVARGLKMMAVRSNVVRTEAHAFYEHLGYRMLKTQYAFRKSLA